MVNYTPLRGQPEKAPFKKGDVLVLFGELFNRGYANGLVEEAEKHEMTVIRATVGRRDEAGQLRALTPTETENIPKPFINVPLEAGFDLEEDLHGKSIVDYLKDVKLSEWEKAQVPLDSLHQAREKGRTRFRNHTKQFILEIEKLVRPGTNVHFAHLMAGGVPRCKIVMPLMNRVFKGTGDRYITSEHFWKSGVGQVLQLNFNEVSAETFNILIDETTSFRERHEKSGGHVSYVAYGYHGTEIVVKNEFKWQSYAPYLQGWAKMELENHAVQWTKKGVKACVYNCPEILTNSSSIFQGVEIPLYNLIRAFDLRAPLDSVTLKIKKDCQTVLKDEVRFEDIYKMVDDFLDLPETKNLSLYENWPQHSNQKQLQEALQTSDKMISLHKDEKVLMTNPLSELIFKACGYVMLHDGYNPKNPVSWIGHDLVVDCIAKTSVGARQ